VFARILVLWVSKREIGTGTEFEPWAGTTKEPENVVEAELRFADGHPAGGVTDEILSVRTVIGTLSGLCAVYQR